MLILEGTDGTGKTTLAKRLAKDLALFYLHLGPVPDGWQETDYLKLGCQKSVFDRFHLSEIVYTLALKGKRRTVVTGPRMLHAALTCKFGMFSVVLTAEDSLIKSRYVKEDQLFSLDLVLEANNLYKRSQAYADMMIHLTEDKPFVDDSDIEKIVAGWRAKQACHEMWLATLKSST